MHNKCKAQQKRIFIKRQFYNKKENKEQNNIPTDNEGMPGEFEHKNR